MALRSTTVKETGHNGLKFREHQLAHLLLDNLKGIELGPSDHNSFNLPGSLSVAPLDGFEFYKAGQVEQSGKYIEIDIPGEADSIPVENDSQDYVLSSHVLEHVPNLFKALLEMIRVVKDGGYIFSIIPQRDALPADVGRPLTTYVELEEAYIKNFTPETMPEERTKAAGSPRGHYWVLSLDQFKGIIESFNSAYLASLGYNLKWVAEEDPDKKVGNGFCVVYQVEKPIMLFANTQADEAHDNKQEPPEEKSIEPEPPTPAPKKTRKKNQ